MKNSKLKGILLVAGGLVVFGIGTIAYRGIEYAVDPVGQEKRAQEAREKENSENNKKEIAKIEKKMAEEAKEIKTAEDKVKKASEKKEQQKKNDIDFVSKFTHNQINKYYKKWENRGFTQEQLKIQAAKAANNINYVVEDIDTANAALGKACEFKNGGGTDTQQAFSNEIVSQLNLRIDQRSADGELK